MSIWAAIAILAAAGFLGAIIGAWLSCRWLQHRAARWMPREFTSQRRS
jgi:membrane protein DedA with SNARE-associated domain